jgi:hypothetical protein
MYMNTECGKTNMNTDTPTISTTQQHIIQFTLQSAHENMN